MAREKNDTVRFRQTRLFDGTPAVVPWQGSPPGSAMRPARVANARSISVAGRLKVKIPRQSIRLVVEGAPSTLLHPMSAPKSMPPSDLLFSILVTFLTPLFLGGATG